MEELIYSIMFVYEMLITGQGKKGNFNNLPRAAIRYAESSIRFAARDPSQCVKHARHMGMSVVGRSRHP